MRTINEFTEELNKLFGNSHNRYSVENGGRKYYKVLQHLYSNTSAYAFVEKSNGNVYMAASYKSPAKHIRGNISDNDITTFCSEYGINYLR